MRHLQKKLRYINPKSIIFDKGNPRGESKSQIVSDPEFKKLVKSIKDFGVLEPLIARKTSKDSDIHVLVDGERRLRASIEAPPEKKFLFRDISNIFTAEGSCLDLICLDE